MTGASDQLEMRRADAVTAASSASWDWAQIEHERPFLAEFCVTGEQMSDVVEHVTNTQYVTWLDRAAELHSDHVGYSRPALLERGVMWFVARHEIDYLAECFLGDELVIATWVESFARVKSWRRYAVLRPADQTVVCRAATLWVLVNLATKRPRRIEPKMVDRFDPLHRQVDTHPASTTNGRAAQRQTRQSI